MTHVRNYVPMIGGERWQNGVRALLAAVVSDHRESDVIRTVQPPFSPSPLCAHGFLPDDKLPLSALRSQKIRVAVKPLEGTGNWQDRLDEEAIDELADTFWSIKY